MRRSGKVEEVAWDGGVKKVFIHLTTVDDAKTAVTAAASQRILCKDCKHTSEIDISQGKDNLSECRGRALC